MNFSELFPDGLIGLIYDCDGVMIDSAEGNRHLYNAILKKLDLPPLRKEQEKFVFQSTFHDGLLYLVPREKHHLIDEAGRTAVDYDREVLPRIRLMPGYREFVQEAARQGLRQAIDTNRTTFGIEKILQNFNLPQVFDPVVCSSVIGRPKPFPDGVEKICSDWNCRPGQVLFIGDSPDDRAAAKGAGAAFAAFGANDLAGDIKIASWPELAAFLWQDPKK